MAVGVMVWVEPGSDTKQLVQTPLVPPVMDPQAGVPDEMIKT